MSIIAMPTTLRLGTFTVGQRRFDLSELSDATGALATRLMAPPRWTMSMAAPSNGISQSDAAVWEAMVLSLRGRVNYLAAFDFVKQVPRGTYTGTITTSGSTAAGATSVTLTGGSGTQTLLQGDWFQVGTGLGSQLFKVMADAAAVAGVITVAVEPPARATFATGSAVTLTRPVAYYKAVTDSPSWSYRPGWNTQMGFALDLVEQWQ